MPKNNKRTVVFLFRKNIDENQTTLVFFWSLGIGECLDQSKNKKHIWFFGFFMNETKKQKLNENKKKCSG